MSRIILPRGVEVADANGWARIESTAQVSVLDEAATFLHRGRQLVGVRSRDEGRWHLSVSHRDRIPTWAELGFARDCLLSADLWLMVPHPPRRLWMNLNPKVLHLWEFRDAPLIAQFTAEGEHAQAHGFGTPDGGVTG